MGKFSRRLKYNKKSLSIDEKIEFLDKEMEKTGVFYEVAPANSTPGVYQQARTDENDKYTNFIACSHNGKGFGISSPNGSAGGAVIEIDDPTLPGVAKSPPHPVTGQRVTAQTHAGFGSFEPTRPGYRRSPNHRMHGSVIWYWDPSAGGGSGSYNSLEYTSPDPHGSNVYTGIEGALFQAGYGYWGSNFIGMPMLRSDGLDANLTDCIRSFDETSGQPDLPVLFPKDLDDPEFMPPKIPGLSDEAFRALLRRLGYDPDSPDSDDPDKTEFKKGERGEREEEEEDNEEEERKKREELIKKLKLGFASTVGVSLKTIQRLWSNGSALGNLWKMTDSFLKGDTDFDSLNRLSNSITKTVGRAIGKQAGVPTPTNFLFKYDKWLASGAKGKVDMTRYIDPRSAKILSNAANKLDGRFMKTETIKQQFKRLTSEGKSREEALDEIATEVQRSVDNQTNADSGNANLKMAIGNGIQIDRKSFIESGGKVIKFSKGYKFAENVGSVKGVGDTMLGRFYGAFGIEMDTFGSGKYAVPAVIGAKYGLQSVHRKYGGSPDRAPQMPYSFTVKSGITGDISESYWKTYEWIDLTKVENDEPISLQEDVKLGHFDPEALTVDIEDIRKGILPEFPKDPPPEMIDGYSKKSKLAPKQLPKDSFIKITKKDLAKNHKLKDSEIKEFMRQIDAVNEYIQKHPEELIYVQQRYPVNDKRLAALNFKMDQMLEAGEEYIDTQFPENQRLVDRIKKATKKTMELTNPEAYKNLNKPDMELMSLDDHMKEKRIVSRHFKKKRQNKSMFRVDMEKVKEKNRKMAEQKVAEWQEKRRIELLNSNEFESEKSDWKKEFQDK